MIPKESIDRIAELSVAASKPELNTAGDAPFVIIPTGMKAESLASLFPPKFINRTVSLIDADSFGDYVLRYKTDNTLLFAKVTDEGCELTAVLDYHGAAPELKPTRCAHKATFKTTPTKEWVTWMTANRKAMNQVEFATWLEDNAKLFVTPTDEQWPKGMPLPPSGADLLELVQNLTGKSEVNFTSTMRLASGANRLNYDEQVELKGQVSTKSEAMVMPPILAAGIKPFEGSLPYDVRARFKHRIEGRRLSLWFETIAPHEIIRDSVKAVVKQVADKTGIIPLLGSV